MTTDGDRSSADRSGEEDGGFVFGEDRWGQDGEESTLGNRLAPAVALLVVAGLVLVGGYLAVGALGGSAEDVLGAAGGSSGPTGSNGSTLSPTDATDDGTPTANPGEGGSTESAADTARTTASSSVASATGSSTVVGSTRNSAATEQPAATGTPRSVEPPTNDRTADEPTSAPRTTDAPLTAQPTVAETTTTASPTTGTGVTGTDATDTATEADTPGETSASQSPLIDRLSTDRRSGDGGATTLAVEWAVADPDGDLETVEVVVVEDPGGNAAVVGQRTIEVDGSEADGDLAVGIGSDPQSAYEIRLEVEDDAGNVAFAATRDDAEG